MHRPQPLGSNHPCQERVRTMAGSWRTYRHSPSPGLPPPRGETKAQQGPSAPLTQLLLPQRTTGTGLDMHILQNSLTHPRQMHSNTTGHFQMLVKLNFEILRVKIQHMDHYFIDSLGC